LLFDGNAADEMRDAKNQALRSAGPDLVVKMLIALVAEEQPQQNNHRDRYA